MYSFTHVKAIIEFSMQICICSPGFDLLIYIYEYIVRYIYIYFQPQAESSASTRCGTIKSKDKGILKDRTSNVMSVCNIYIFIYTHPNVYIYKEK